MLQPDPTMVSELANQFEEDAVVFGPYGEAGRPPMRRDEMLREKAKEFRHLAQLELER